MPSRSATVDDFSRLTRRLTVRVERFEALEQSVLDLHEVVADGNAALRSAILQPRPR